MKRKWIYLLDSLDSRWLINLDAIHHVYWQTASTAVVFVTAGTPTFTTTWADATDAESVYDQVLDLLDRQQQKVTV